MNRCLSGPWKIKHHLILQPLTMRIGRRSMRRPPLQTIPVIIRAEELQPAIAESETSDEADTAPPEEEGDPEWANGDEHLELPSENDYVERAPRLITVVLEAGPDDAKDGRKLTRIHNTLLQYPGKDRFEIVVQRGDKSIPLTFPDQTTHICEELSSDLIEIVGGEVFLSVDDQH